MGSSRLYTFLFLLGLPFFFLKPYSLLLALPPLENGRNMCRKEKIQINFKMWISELVAVFNFSISLFFLTFGTTVHYIFSNVLYSFWNQLYQCIHNRWKSWESFFFFLSCVSDVLGYVKQSLSLMALSNSRNGFSWWSMQMRATIIEEILSNIFLILGKFTVFFWSDF